MNKSDSERIGALLEKKGLEPVLEKSQADLILVNMCSVRQSAVDRVFGAAEKIAVLKKRNPRLKAVLTGCILKEDKRKFREKFDEIWDNKDLTNLPAKCKNKHLAFIPISNGCNNFCSYCVVPFTRGPLVCRDHREILKEIKEVVNPIRNKISNGAREIWLLGQNVNDYQSPTDSSIDFPRLLREVDKLPGDFKIRFTSPNPKNFSEELIEAMAELKKVAKYINLPVQSGDDKILKRMNRSYSASQYKDLVRKIRERMPDVNLSTDVIVGFPTETKEQFENTAKLFKEVKFNIAYIAKYSPRPGTAASKLKDDVPLEEKKRREKCLRKLIQN